MTKNGKAASKKSKNGYRMKITGSLYKLTKERNENCKWNRKCQESKEQTITARTKAK